MSKSYFNKRIYFGDDLQLKKPQVHCEAAYSNTIMTLLSMMEFRIWPESSQCLPKSGNILYSEH